MLLPASIVLKNKEMSESVNAPCSSTADLACNSNLKWPPLRMKYGAAQHTHRNTEAVPPSFPTDWDPKFLPPEVWQLIFNILLAMENYASFQDVVGDGIWGRKIIPTCSPAAASLSIFPQTPSTLSQVCSLWQGISFGMPELWSMIKIILPQGSAVADVQAQTIGTLITLRLRRASTCPLAVSINVRDDLELARALLRSLIPVHSQWNSLYLDVPSQSLSEFVTLRKGDVPLLTSVKLLHNAHIPRRLDAESIIFLDADTAHLCNISSALRRLCISSLILPTIDTTFCSHLHEVNIQQSPSETWSTLRFLEACPQLRVLTLSGYGVTFGVPLSDYAGISLPELETLNLEHPSGRHWLLRMLVLPKLKSLWLGGRLSYQVTSIELLLDIADLLRRSGCESLECLSLELEIHGLDTSTVVEFLKANSALRKLTINDAWTFMNKPLVTSELFALLTLPEAAKNELASNSTGVCPRLTQIRFMNCSRFDDDAYLVRFVRSRLMTPCKLQERRTDTSDIQSVEISCKGSWQKIAAAVHPFSEQGLAITVTGA